jgi:hypothetical protein
MPLTLVNGNLSPIPLAPDIDTDVEFDYSMENGHLLLSGTAWGDDFPNLEIYATDSRGNTVMLGTFQTKEGAAGPIHSLWGAGERESEDQVMRFDAAIDVSSTGEFMSAPDPVPMTSSEDE